jgi:hypothetical protein
VHGWNEDQRWTPARIVRLTFELFKVRYTPKGMSLLLKQLHAQGHVAAVEAQ